MTRTYSRTRLLISSESLQKFLELSINLLSKSKMALEEHFGRASFDGCFEHFSFNVLKQNCSHYNYIRREKYYNSETLSL